MSRKAGFTLVELLVVIAIIGVLASLLVPTIGMARRKANAAASTVTMDSIKIGINAYQADEGFYPGAGIKGSTPTKDDPEGLFKALMGDPKSKTKPRVAGRNSPYVDPSTDYVATLTQNIDAWLSDTEFVDPIFEVSLKVEGLPLPLEPAVNTGKYVFVDAWGVPYRYVEYESRSRSKKKRPTGNGGGGGQAYKPNGFEIWSAGPDMTTSYNPSNESNEDDLTNW